MKSASVTVVGQRLRNLREGCGLSGREFAEKLREDHTLMWRIESGKRFPPKSKRQKFAKALSLTPKQLDALIAVERRGLNPHELLPEIPPAHISNNSIEAEAAKVLEQYCRTRKVTEPELPVPIEAVLATVCKLQIECCDFKKHTPLLENNLCGCLFPDGFNGKDRVVLVNTGSIRGHGKPSTEERRITMAHETGHYILHCSNKESKQLFFRFSKGPTFCRKAECDDCLLDPREYQAHSFAACLLLPRQQFKEARSTFANSVRRLAKEFKVTESLVKFRIKLCE